MVAWSLPSLQCETQSTIGTLQDETPKLMQFCTVLLECTSIADHRQCHSCVAWMQSLYCRSTCHTNQADTEVESCFVSPAAIAFVAHACYLHTYMCSLSFDTAAVLKSLIICSTSSTSGSWHQPRQGGPFPTVRLWLTRLQHTWTHVSMSFNSSYMTPVPPPLSC